MKYFPLIFVYGFGFLYSLMFSGLPNMTKEDEFWLYFITFISGSILTLVIVDKGDK